MEMLSGRPTVSLVIHRSQLLWRVSSLDSWVLDKARDSAAMVFHVLVFDVPLDREVGRGMVFGLCSILSLMVQRSECGWCRGVSVDADADGPAQVKEGEAAAALSAACLASSSAGSEGLSWPGWCHSIAAEACGVVSACGRMHTAHASAGYGCYSGAQTEAQEAQGTYGCKGRQCRSSACQIQRSTHKEPLE